MKQKTDVLQEVGDRLEGFREDNNPCPSQKEGVEVDGTQSRYCLLPALVCEHQGRIRNFDQGDLSVSSYHLCKYRTPPH